MNGYITDTRLNSIAHLPMAVPETELRSGSTMFVSLIQLAANQTMEIRSLSLQVLKVLTTGVIPSSRYGFFGLCSIGVYANGGTGCPLIYVAASNASPVSSNAFRRWTARGPGTYQVIIQNNTWNMDLSVAASGSAKIYY